MWNASFELTLWGCVISICCVGFESLDVVFELNDCAWNVGLYQLSDKCVYVYCVKYLLISSATVIVRTGDQFGRIPYLRCCLLCVVPSL